MASRTLWTLPILAACAGPAAPNLPSLPTAENDSCNVRQYAELINQDATALEKVLILGQVRLIRPGTAITKDYRIERTNIDINSENRIVRLWCG